MTAPYDPLSDGWKPMDQGAALPGGLGLPLARQIDGAWHYGLQTRADHANPNGVLHGGVLMSFADHALSMLAWEAGDRAPCTTIQLNTHFLDAIKPGEFIECRGEVTRRTRSLIFLRGVVSVRHHHAWRDVGAVDGIWRSFHPR